MNLPSSKESELLGLNNNKLNPIITEEPTVKEKIYEMIVSHRNEMADSFLLSQTSEQLELWIW